MRIALLAALTLLVASPVATRRPAVVGAADCRVAGRVHQRPGARVRRRAAPASPPGTPRSPRAATSRRSGPTAASSSAARWMDEVRRRPARARRASTAVLIRKRTVTKTTFRTRDALSVRFGTPAHPRGRVRRVGATHDVFGEDQGPALAVSGDEVAVAWVEKAGQERHRYRVAFSRGGRAFGRPQTLTTRCSHA